MWAAALLRQVGAVLMPGKNGISAPNGPDLHVTYRTVWEVRGWHG